MTLARSEICLGLRQVLITLAHASNPPNRVAAHLLNRDIVEMMDFVSAHPEAIAIARQHKQRQAAAA